MRHDSFHLCARVSRLLKLPPGRHTLGTKVLGRSALIYITVE
jgi:hypothetical protein